MLHANEISLPLDHRIGGNNPPEPIVAPEDQRIADLVRNADAWAEQHPIIEDEDVGNEAANWLKQLNDDLEAFEEAFKKEKAPHEEKLAEIRGKFHPRIDRLKICIKAIRPLFRAWIGLRDKRIKDDLAAKQRAADEAQRHADQLTEQAAAGGRSTVTNMVNAAEAAEEAARARKAVAAAPMRAQVRGSLGGPTHSLRTVWRALMIEQDLFYLHVRDHKDVKVLLQSLANAAARHGTRNPNLPGCEIYSTQE